MATFKKSERLCSKIEISNLFKRGKAVSVPPFRFVFLLREASSHPPIRVLISVPKKYIPLATDRNLLKRRIREAYRHLKPDLYRMPEGKTLDMDVAILYFGRECADYKNIVAKVAEGFSLIAKKLINKG